MPHLALTATATPKDIQQLCSILEFDKPAVVIQNTDRTNIFYEIRERLPNIKKYEKYNEILQDICEEFESLKLKFPVTIVYCDNLEAIRYSYMYCQHILGEQAYYPEGENIPENRIFGQYHKDYSEEMKLHIVAELSLKNPKLRLVFASVALGMGLNSPSVSRIIHMRPPTSIEKYVQEVGRAGRSGQKAKAILYYNKNDIASNRKGLESTISQFVKLHTCLRSFILNYFGFDGQHQVAAEMCCSNCKARAE